MGSRSLIERSSVVSRSGRSQNFRIQNVWMGNMPPSHRTRQKQTVSVAANIYALPDELLLKIVKIAARDGSTNEGTGERDDDYGRAWFAARPHLRPNAPVTTPCCQYNHRLVANVVSEISV